MVAARFITFEGGEGAGKSTHVKRLAEALATAGIDNLTTREPGGAPGAEEIRQLLVTGETGRWDATSEALLHFAARRAHVEETVRPALGAGRWVICDRFADSTLAYQGYGRGLDKAAIEALGRLVLGDLAPDLTLILDLPAENGLLRAAARGEGGDRYERMGEAFHRRIGEGFRAIAKANPARCRLIDGTGSVAEIQAVIERVISQKFAQAGS